MSENPEHIIKPVSMYVKSLGEILKKRKQTPDFELISMPRVSKRLWLFAKEMMVLGARTSQGKTSLALNMAYDFAVQGKRVLFLSLEMTVESLAERLLCRVQGIPSNDLQEARRGSLESDLESFASKVRELPLIITNSIGFTWKQLDEYIEYFSPKPEVIIIDYIGLVNGSGAMKKEIIDDYLKHFRQMAIRDNFLGIICAQINRASQGSSTIPQLHNLKDTGCLEEIADKVLLLHYPNFYDETKPENEYQLILAKNRNGRTGSLDVRFMPKYFLFEDLKREFINPPVEIQKTAKLFDGKVFRETQDWD